MWMRLCLLWPIWFSGGLSAFKIHVVKFLYRIFQNLNPVAKALKMN